MFDFELHWLSHNGTGCFGSMNRRRVVAKGVKFIPLSAWPFYFPKLIFRAPMNGKTFLLSFRGCEDDE
jgi:hypothetical protein